jgi:hypothetical protein
MTQNYAGNYFENLWPKNSVNTIGGLLSPWTNHCRANTVGKLRSERYVEEPPSNNFQKSIVK